MLIARDAGKPAGISGLGMIPSWQFSNDPAINPKINPHVVYPSGMYQTTVQPVGPYFSGMNGLSGLNGLSGMSTLWWLLSAASSGASAYHGYKRNKSVGWAVAWGLLGGVFPVLVPAVALAQGFGKSK